MTPMPRLPPYEMPMREAKSGGMVPGAYDRGGNESLIEMMLDPELLGALCRRSRRRMRDIQSSCQVVMKVDRVRGTLRIHGTEASIKAAQHQLSSLAGPRKQVPPAVWAELMRTRTQQSSSQAIVLHLQELSGCRIHIERSRHEVRIFGPRAGTIVADKLLEELAKQCIDEAIHVGSISTLCTSTLQDMAHVLSVTMRLEEQQVVVLGLQGKVKVAVQVIKQYVSDPDGYKLQLSEEAWEAVNSAWPDLSVEGIGLSEPGSSSGSPSGSGDLPPHPQTTVVPTTLMTNRKTAPRWNPQSRPQAVAPQAQAGPKGTSCATCPTCGVGRFCLFCGEPTWMFFSYGNVSGSWCAGPGAQCSPSVGASAGGSCRQMRQVATDPPKAQFYFGEAHDMGSARLAVHAPTVPASSPPAGAPPVGEPVHPGRIPMQKNPVAFYTAAPEALEPPQCMVGPRSNAVVVGGVVPMCFPMSMDMAPDQAAQWITADGMPVLGLPDAASNNSNQLMRHVYMVPAYAQPGVDEQ